MTFDEYLKYEHTVERKSKALAMTGEQQDKYRKAINELNDVLVKGFDGYYEFWITGGQNDLTEAEKRVLGCFVKMRAAISRCIVFGDLEGAHTGLTEMRFILFKLRGKEFEMPKFKRQETEVKDEFKPGTEEKGTGADSSKCNAQG